MGVYDSGGVWVVDESIDERNSRIADDDYDYLAISSDLETCEISVPRIRGLEFELMLFTRSFGCLSCRTALEELQEK